MKKMFREHRFNSSTLIVIEQTNRILVDYARKGYDLTLRQIYYQFVAHDLFPNDRRWRWTGTRWVKDPNGTKNATPNYKWLGDIIDKGRLAGLIDWDHIEDRTRNLKGRSSWGSPVSMIGSAFEGYHRDRWHDQPVRVELWVEKEALVGIFSRICHKWDVDFFACRGYVSQSEMYRAAMRHRVYNDKGQKVIVLHFGDHDPSGIDMTRDIEDRLHMFGASVEVRRMALNMDQVKEYDPPPNPAKQTDSRFDGYVDRFGDESWELDALNPEALVALVEGAINEYRDTEAWTETVEEEIDGRTWLKVARDQWSDLIGHMQDEFAAEVAQADEDLREEYAFELE